jgi:glycosyltransferase involved in cell wall biosynthesis
MLPINRPVISILNFIERVACTLSGAVLIPDPERLEQLGVSPNSSIRKKTLVIRNSQPYSHWKKRNLIIGNGKPISLVYSGTLTASIRGLEHIVHVLSKLHGAVTCTVIGYGGDEKKLVPLLSSCQHITFLGKMDPKNVRAITEKHDIVISLLDPSYTNYKYASSTKALEAISLGIPVITTEETATGNLIRQYDWGWVIPYSEDALYSLLLQLTNSGQTIRLNPETAESLDWKHSAAQLQSLYSPKKAIQAETV